MRSGISVMRSAIRMMGSSGISAMNNAVGLMRRHPCADDEVMRSSTADSLLVIGVMNSVISLTPARRR